MTRNEAIYDIITILTKAGYTDDSRLDPDYIGYKIDEKRAKEIRDSYNRTPLIDPIWLQDYGVFDLTKVNYADDKSFNCLQELSKATLPTVVSFYNGLASAQNLGVYSLRSVSGREEFFYKPHSKMIEILNELSDNHPLRRFSYYSKLQNSIYAVSKNGDSIPEKLRAVLILENPLDGYVLTTENVNTLVVGTQYDVVDGQIIHNGVAYDKGSTFAAVNKVFSGLGKVQYHNQKRKMTGEDPYPFSKSQMEVVILKLLTQEYGIEATKVADIRNQSQDELKIINEPST